MKEDLVARWEYAQRDFYVWLACHLPDKLIVSVILRACEDLPAAALVDNPKTGLKQLRPHTTHDLITHWASRAFGRKIARG